MTPLEPHEIYWAPPAIRALERLPEKVATAAVEFIYEPLADNPARVGHRFASSWRATTAPIEATTGWSTGSMTSGRE